MPAVRGVCWQCAVHACAGASTPCVLQGGLCQPSAATHRAAPAHALAAVCTCRLFERARSHSSGLTECLRVAIAGGTGAAAVMKRRRA
jgi:hypothetical protein